MSEMVKRVATAMASKRMELIAQPLSRIWDELAAAAIKEMREPTDAMVRSGYKAIRSNVYADVEHGEAALIVEHPAGAEVWTAMIDAKSE